MNPTAVQTKRGNNSWFVTVPIVAASVAFWFFVYRPTHEEIRQMQAELELKQQSLADAATLPEKLRRSREELAAAEKFVQSWQQAASRKSFPELFGKLSALVAASGSKSTTFHPEPVITYRCMERLPLSLACQGSFQQVFQLLCKLEQLAEVVWIEEVHIEQLGKNGPSVSCGLKLEIFTGKSNLADSSD